LLDWWKQLKNVLVESKNIEIQNKSGHWFYTNEKGVPILWNHALEPNQICHSLLDIAMLITEIDKILLPILAKKNNFLAKTTRCALVGIPVVFLLFVVGMNGTGMTGVKTDDLKLTILTWLWNIYQAVRT
jgi:hypothetical protein